MSSPVAELETGLQGMLGLKPPGVSGSRITSITQLCVNNVQSESVLIQKIYTHFKKTPGTHKLGVLYVVDSVTRKWMDQAKAQGQTISSAAQDGTYAAGVHRVTELMPVLMNDIIATAPEDQKEKIKKLVDIWEKGQTFPPSLLTSFREKLSAPPASTTPEGSPPAGTIASLGPNSRPGAAAPTPAPAMPNIMEALANIARQNASAPQSNPNVTAPAPAYSLSGAYSSVAAPVSAATPQPGMPGMPGMSGLPGFPGLPFAAPAQPAGPPVNLPAGMPAMPFAFPPQPQPQVGQGQHGLPGAMNFPAAGHNAGWPSNPVAPAVPNAGLDPKVQQQLVLIQTLAAQGIPLDKISQVIALMGSNAGTPAAAPSVPPPQQLPQPTSSYAAPSPWEAPRPDGSRDNKNDYRDAMRSPNRHNGRSRSRSPARWDPQQNRAGGRGGYDYGTDSPNGRRAGQDDRDRGRDAYRQRSPAGRRGFSPEEEPPAEKWIEFDPTLANGSIKVYSRTLFVGGVTCSEHDLRQIFSRFGKVQTCIVNKDKRHAFVKMFYRKDAVKAKEGMDEHRNSDLPLRTRWGVGFGPRDCSDYQTGISIIPIHKLTDADRKWMLTAPFGGSGGRPIATGLCVEEPDIEIGAGVSSKAISRRMQTDKSGNQGPRSSREDENPNHLPPGPGRGGMGGRGDANNRFGRRGARGDGRDTGRREERERDSRPSGNGQNTNEEPVVLGFPPGITMGPNGINFPPGFTFGAPNGSS